MTAVESTRAALLAAVLADPDDDSVRLVFADWLGEHGEEERGEFIRVQCELARCHHDEFQVTCDRCGLNTPLRRREAELMTGNRLSQWSGDLLRDIFITCDDDALDWQYRRGFVHSVTLPAADWLKNADDLLRLHPAREVTLTTWPCARSRVAVGSQPFGEFWSLHPGWSVEEPQVITMHHDREMLVRGVLKKRWPLIAFMLPS